ncbi:MAG TPA: hypothetical protein VJ063_16040, partial [Verrucomicrobiae bacterium]|nr:hypothetical protein [Verrucomicrobiae bacterium]
MPGIFGIITNRNTPDNARMLQAMSRCMMHESFYTSATHVDQKLGVWAGSIAHKGSFSDCTPFWNETKDVCLLFSGESLGDQSEIARLKAMGHQFTSGNASYLVHMYEEMGSTFLDRLNGWFSGLLLDLRRGEAILFNDRYGLGRVYCYETPSGFFFSSEAKSLLRVLPAARDLNLQSLGEFLSCGCALQNRT